MESFHFIPNNRLESFFESHSLHVFHQENKCTKPSDNIVPPNATISYDYDYGQVPLTVTFTVTFSSPYPNKINYTCDFWFGDGQYYNGIVSSGMLTLIHTYTDIGNFEVVGEVSYTKDQDSIRAFTGGTIKVVNEQTALITDATRIDGIWDRKNGDFTFYSPTKFHLGGERLGIITGFKGFNLELQKISGGQWVSAPYQTNIVMSGAGFQAIRAPSDNAWYRWKASIPVTAMGDLSSGSYTFWYR